MVITFASLLDRQKRHNPVQLCKAARQPPAHSSSAAAHRQRHGGAVQRAGGPTAQVSRRRLPPHSLPRSLPRSLLSSRPIACRSSDRHTALPLPRRRATFDELLAPPAGDDASAPTGTVVRASASYACRDERFLLKHKEYDRQYAQLYFYRLLQMRAHLEAAARSAWPGIQGAGGRWRAMAQCWACCLSTMGMARAQAIFSLCTVPANPAS